MICIIFIFFQLWEKLLLNITGILKSILLWLFPQLSFPNLPNFLNWIVDIQ